MTELALFELMSEADCELLARSDARVNVRRRIGLRVLAVAAAVSVLLIVSLFVGAFAVVRNYKEQHPEIQGGIVEVLGGVLADEDSFLSEMLPENVKLELGDLIVKLGGENPFVPLGPGESESETESETEPNDNGLWHNACEYCGKLDGENRWFIAKIIDSKTVMPIGENCFEAMSAGSMGFRLNFLGENMIDVQGFAPGDIVRITYSGCVLETAPCKIYPDSVELVSKAEAERNWSYDPQEVYDHVFNRQSRMLTEEEAERLKIGAYYLNTAKQQAVIEFLFIDQENSDDGWYRSGTYLVEGLTTDLPGYENNTKYTLVLDAPTQNEVNCMYDYHEAYLDVLFEHLSFTECASIPGTEQRVYEIGKILVDDFTYLIRADGHIYYEKNGVCYQSDQTVDIAYLTAILFVTKMYFAKELDIETFGFYGLWNEEIPSDAQIQYFSSLDQDLYVWNGEAYDDREYGWTHVIDPEYTMEYMIGIYCHYFYVYPAPENNK